MSNKTPMLLTQYDAAVFKKNPCVYVSEKYDGWRMYYHAGSFYTRAGNLLVLPDSFADALRVHEGYDFDGELWLGYGTTSTDVATFDATTVRFMIFDAVHADAPTAPYEQRLAALKTLDIAHDRITIVEQTVCNSEAELNAVYDAVIARGGEGVVVRIPSQVYVHGGRERFFMKKKPIDTVEALVTGYHNTGKACERMPPGYVSSLIVKTLTEDAHVFKVTVKSTHPPPIGSVAMVRYSQTTATGLPKFPVLIGVRDAADMPLDVSKALLAEQMAKTSRPKKAAGSFKPVDPAELDWLSKHPKCAGIATAASCDCDGPSEFAAGFHKYYDNQRGDIYKISRAKDGTYYCSCKAWLFQSLPAKYRTCKHCIAVADYQPVVPFAVRKAMAERKARKAQELAAKAERAAKRAAKLNATLLTNMP
jgi:ATP-dependent DNA ligase